MHDAPHGSVELKDTGSKLHAYQFHTGDWVKDTRHLSLAARGAWIDILAAMSSSQTRGVVTYTMMQLTRYLGVTVDQAHAVINELRDPENPTGKAVCEYEELADGKFRLISRRMTRDEQTRLKRAAGGILGGNPALIAQKVNHKDNHPPNLSSVLHTPISIDEKETDPEKAADQILVSHGLAVNAGPKQISILRKCIECFGISQTNNAICEAESHHANMPIEYAATMLARMAGKKAADRKSNHKTIQSSAKVYE